ncbi:MAG TPA: S41 family peptidase, partial [Gemmataceae bacterium]|nr:S41 family peptidase [Gemmataceae bacterium]
MTKAMWTGVFACACTLLALTAPAWAAEAKKPQPYIVVVGVSNYQDKQLLPRTHAEDDARALFELYTNKDYYGVDADHSRLLLGSADGKDSKAATRQNILDALKWITRETGPNDPVVFAFFGDGGPLGDRGDHHCYFAADSTFKGRDKDSVAAPEIAEALKGFKSQDFAVFLDVNFKGYTVPGDKNIAEPSFTDKPFSEFRGDLGSDDENEERTPGRVVFLPNRPNSPSLDGPEHGLFAMALLEGLKGAADADGDEADGVVTVDELAKYLDKQIPELARKYGKTDKDKEQVSIVLGSPNSHFVLSHDPEPYKKAQERLAKFETLVSKERSLLDVADEGRQYLARMPRLKAQRELRKDYQKLVDGDLSPVDFAKARAKVLDETKLAGSVADKFAGKVIDASRIILADYYKEENQGELVSQAIHKLYKYLEEKVPDAIEERVAKAKTMKESELRQLLIDARSALGEREDLDKDKDIDVALVEMLQSLDPYTTYIDPETLNNFKIQIQGNFTGIGIQIRKDAATDLLLVVTPIKGSPAYKAGILAGDLITQISRDVDEKGDPLPKGTEVIPTKGLLVGDAVKKILGKEGTKVKLTVQREGVDKPMEFTMQRDEIPRASVDQHFFIRPGIAYMHISGFQETTGHEVAQALDEFGDNNIKGMILDMRGNPGGVLSEAVSVSDKF